MATVTFFGSDDNPEFALGSDYHYQDELSIAGSESSSDGTSTPSHKHQFVLLEFDTKVNCSTDSLIIGSKLDTDVHTSHCRLAFSGRLVFHTTDASFRTSVLPQIKIFKPKVRTGVVDRLHDEYHVIGRALFSKETTMDKFLGLKVTGLTGNRMHYVQVGSPASGPGVCSLEPVEQQAPGSIARTPNVLPIEALCTPAPSIWPFAFLHASRIVRQNTL